ncbi:hypothetical protein MHYP_G00303080 [Metynnis hypsauchen]
MKERSEHREECRTINRSDGAPRRGAETMPRSGPLTQPDMFLCLDRTYSTVHCAPHLCRPIPHSRMVQHGRQPEMLFLSPSPESPRPFSHIPPEIRQDKHASLEKQSICISTLSPTRTCGVARADYRAANDWNH